MTHKEHSLLRVLALAAILCATTIGVFLEWERILSARSSLRLYETGLEELSLSNFDEHAAAARIAQLQALIAARTSVTAVSAADPGLLARLGREVRTALARAALEPLRYQVVGSGTDEGLEFALRGSATSFLRFLRDSGERNGGWRVSFVNLRNNPDTGLADVVFRVVADAR